MGAWSHENFGNDTACDWAYGLEELDDLSLIEAALGAVFEAPDGDLDADVACEALAAAEVLARLRGQPGEGPEAVDDWVARTRLSPPEALVQRALAALDRIGGPDSELKDLWDESDSADDWRASLSDLRARLQAPPQPLPAPLDTTARLARDVAALKFEVPDFPSSELAGGLFAGLARPQLFAVIVAAETLGQPAAVREGIARFWPLLDAEADAKIHWDLAVREAKTWAAEGRLSEALAGLEAWRETAEALAPGTFDMRAMAVCQEAGDYEQAEALRERLIDAGRGADLQWMDRALLQARAGSASDAEALLAAHGARFDTPALQPWRDFTRGILAAREGRPEALELLTPRVEAWLAQCAAGPAIWPFFGIGAGWWAVALRQAGRTEEARAVGAALQPLILTPENALAVQALKAASLLDADAPLRERPSPPSPVSELPGVETDHGVFRTVTVRGVNALKQLQALRRAFVAGSGRYPFLIGDAADLEALLESLEPPPDGGLATLAAARDIDAAAWLQARAAKVPRWRAASSEPNRQLQSQFELSSGRLKPLMFIGLVEMAEPCELFARLGWGGWNDCPAPEVHVALHRHWRKRFGVEPVALSGAVVECEVAAPPADRKAALALAVEHHAYCADIVEQGVGSTAALGAMVLEAPVWYFWWD